MDSIILEPRTEPVCPVSKIVRPRIEIWKPWIDIICPRYNWNKIHIKYKHYIKVQGATDNTFKVSKHSFFFNESEEIPEVSIWKPTWGSIQRQSIRIRDSKRNWYQVTIKLTSLRSGTDCSLSHSQWHQEHSNTDHCSLFRVNFNFFFFEALKIWGSNVILD